MEFVPSALGDKNNLDLFLESQLHDKYKLD